MLVLVSHNLQHSSSDTSLGPSLSIMLMWPCEPVSGGHKTLQSFPPRTVSTSEGTKEEVDFANIPTLLKLEYLIIDRVDLLDMSLVGTPPPPLERQGYHTQTRLLALHTLLTEDTFTTK